MLINLLNPISIENKLEVLMEYYLKFSADLIESNNLHTMSLTVLSEVITINIKTLNIDIHKFKFAMIPYLNI